MDEWGKGFLTGVVVLLFIALVVLLSVWRAFDRDTNIPFASTCALGGYGDWTYFGLNTDAPICIGLIDGEWKVELLSDVQSRMKAN